MAENNSYALSEEKLDELFVKEVASVAKLAAQLPSKDSVMPTCARWFNIFRQSTPKEKFARNCLLLLLHKQLNDNSALSVPFTEAQNHMRRDLRSLHELTLLKGAKANASSAVETSDSLEWCSLGGSINSMDVDCGAMLYLRLEDANRQLLEENAALASELQRLEQQQLRLQERQQSCEKISATLREENMMYDKELSYLQDIFACSAITALKKLDGAPSLVVKPQYFATLFSVLCEDEVGVAQVEALDKQFGQLLRAYIDRYMQQQRDSLLEQVSQDYDKLRARISRRYKKVLRMQSSALEKELTLAAMRFLTVLRKVFLDSYQGTEWERRAVLKFLHRRYIEVAEAL